MYISRLVIRNYRNFRNVDVKLSPGVNCFVGENNTGKSNLISAVRLDGTGIGLRREGV